MPALINITAEPALNARLSAILSQEDRLAELIHLQDRPDKPTGFFIDARGIRQAFPWHEQVPPVLFANPLPLSAPYLLALIFAYLGNWEKAYAYAEETGAGFNKDLDLMNRLQSGAQTDIMPIPAEPGGGFDRYRMLHNRAVTMHYGHTDHTNGKALPVEEMYQLALEACVDDASRAFTLKHLATFYLDQSCFTEAGACLEDALAAAGGAESRIAILSVLYSLWLSRLTVPYDPNLLMRTKEAAWEVLQYYESNNMPLQAGMALTDAAQIANFSESFAEALGYVNRAIGLLEEGQMPELTANAQYRKGVVLFTWAQNGNPQFYRGAMQAYQEALKVFNRENTPEVFAEIQHHLGVVYSEIPDETKKKSIWAAVSSSSFKMALDYFTEKDHPYAYAQICNHYANALTKYPAAKLGDNYRKALGYYREALKIRTASDYPYERALTILNYLEACWLVGEYDPLEQKGLFEDMLAKASEAAVLVPDKALAAEAETHLANLMKLKEKLS